MLMTSMGHAFYVIRTEAGTTIATDPYGDFYQYPKRRVHADICTISHHHHDHDGVNCLMGEPIILDAPCARRTLADGVSITGVLTAHDDRGGALRGKNVVFIIEAEGLRVAHAGDLGHVPTPAQAHEIGDLDVLLLPVGGFYTIDPAAALETARLLKPRVLIPMHYRTEYNQEMPVGTLDDFAAVLGRPLERASMLRVVREDISEQPSVIALNCALAD